MTITAAVESFPHVRQFGLELEFFNISEGRVQTLLQGAGIQCWRSYYEDSGTGWEITDDGSIVGDYSVELVSPILSGVEGLRQVAKVVRILSDAGAKVNKSCGFHVHVDANDLPSNVLLNVYRRYALHESMIDTFMVKSRRANNNEYCKSTRNLLDRTVNVAKNMDPSEVAELMDERCIGGRWSGGRYNKVNLCAYLRHGTIEFRHHGGTMNVDKVLSWVMFCVNFVETSMESETAELFADVHPDVIQFFTNRALSLV